MEGEMSNSRDLLELRFDGPIPLQAAPLRPYTPALTMRDLEDERVLAEMSARDWWRQAKVALRAARVNKARPNWSRDYVNRCRQEARDCLDRMRLMRRVAKSRAEELNRMMAETCAERAAAE